MTNAEHIRHEIETDEGLAKYLANQHSDGCSCLDCPAYDYCWNYTGLTTDSCREIILEWLKLEHI